MASDEDYKHDFNQFDYDKYKDSGLITNIKNNLDLVKLSDWVMIILVASSILLLSGLIFVFTETPDFIGRNIFGTQFIFNLPVQDKGKANPNGQTHMYVFELLVVAGIISMGVIGLYLIRNATRFIDESEKGVQVLAVGVLMILIALVLLFFLYNFKQTSQFPNISGLKE